jgi:hypothetical protein
MEAEPPDMRYQAEPGNKYNHLGLLYQLVVWFAVDSSLPHRKKSLTFEGKLLSRGDRIFTLQQ